MGHSSRSVIRIVCFAPVEVPHLVGKGIVVLYWLIHGC